jgi:hypothetical protein
MSPVPQAIRVTTEEDERRRTAQIVFNILRQFGVEINEKQLTSYSPIRLWTAHHRESDASWPVGLCMVGVFYRERRLKRS